MDTLNPLGLLPNVKTKTRRKTAAAEVKRKATAYVNLVSLNGDETIHQPARVLALLWIIAHAQRALALETRGVLGDLYATPTRVAGRTLEYPRGANRVRQEATPPPCEVAE